MVVESFVAELEESFDGFGRVFGEFDGLVGELEEARGGSGGGGEEGSEDAEDVEVHVEGGAGGGEDREVGVEGVVEEREDLGGVGVRHGGGGAAGMAG